MPRSTTTITVDIDTDLFDALESLASKEDDHVETIIENALRDAVARARPYVVTQCELSDRARYVMSRHATLGGAVEALREVREDDRETMARGLPTHDPRIEHNGRPVDVDA